MLTLPNCAWDRSRSDTLPIRVNRFFPLPCTAIARTLHINSTKEQTKQKKRYGKKTLHNPRGLTKVSCLH